MKTGRRTFIVSDWSGRCGEQLRLAFGLKPGGREWRIYGDITRAAKKMYEDGFDVMIWRRHQFHEYDVLSVDTDGFQRDSVAAGKAKKILAGG